MLLTTLVRAARGFKHSSHSFRPPTQIACRTLFYPSGPPPSADSNDAKFPPEDRSHLSEGQFNTVRNSGGTQSFSAEIYSGLIPGSRAVLKHGSNTPAEAWEQSSSRFGETQRQPPGVHKGRTVVVRRGDDVGHSYAKLQAILRSNNVRKELRLAERHEKKGAKRRRLCSERWRRKFADEVRKKVKLVTEIRLRDRMWGARH